eukprot:1157342-Pelagomonas_calceolata.AAC.12
MKWVVVSWESRCAPVPPALLDPSEQAERGISRLPASLSDAISQLETGRNPELAVRKKPMNHQIAAYPDATVFFLLQACSAFWALRQAKSLWLAIEMAWMCDELQAMYATLLGPCLMRAYLAVRRAEAAKGPIDMPRMHLLY